VKSIFSKSISEIKNCLINNYKYYLPTETLVENHVWSIIAEKYQKLYITTSKH